MARNGFVEAVVVMNSVLRGRCGRRQGGLNGRMRAKQGWIGAASQAWRIAVWSITGFFWLLWFQVFLGHMLPRIDAILNGAPLANTPPCDAVQCDFSVFWPASQLAQQRQFNTLYSPHAFSLFREHVLFAGEPRLDWYYPPPSLLPLLPLGHLSVGVAFLVWTVLLILLAVVMLRTARVSWMVICCSLVSPAALWCIEVGQWDIFCGAALIAGFLLLSQRPFASGILLSLLIFKPQPAIVTPVALFAQRHWRVMIGGLVGATVICLATTMLLGGDVWRQWLLFGLADARQNLIRGHPIGLEESASLFWALRKAGASLSEAFLAQNLCAVFALAAVWHAWSRPYFEKLDRIAIVVIASTLVCPYFFVVDLVALGIVLTLVMEHKRWQIGSFDALLWLWPMLSPAIFIWTGWLLSPFVMLLGLLYFWSINVLKFRTLSVSMNA